MPTLDGIFIVNQVLWYQEHRINIKVIISWGDFLKVSVRRIVVFSKSYIIYIILNRLFDSRSFVSCQYMFFIIFDSRRS